MACFRLEDPANGGGRVGKLPAKQLQGDLLLQVFLQIGFDLSGDVPAVFDLGVGLYTLASLGGRTFHKGKNQKLQGIFHALFLAGGGGRIAVHSAIFGNFQRVLGQQQVTGIGDHIV